MAGIPSACEITTFMKAFLPYPLMFQIPTDANQLAPHRKSVGNIVEHMSRHIEAKEYRMSGSNIRFRGVSATRLFNIKKSWM